MTVGLLTLDYEDLLLIESQSHDPTGFVLKEDQMVDWNGLHPYGPPTVSKATQQAIGLIPYD